MTGHAHVAHTERKPLAHPLAHRTGVEALLQFIAADTHWRALTTRQQSALRDAYDTALAAAVTAGVEEIDLPELAPDVHPLTRAALERKGLVAGNRLTELAVEVARWSKPMQQQREARRQAQREEAS